MKKKLQNNIQLMCNDHQIILCGRGEVGGGGQNCPPYLFVCVLFSSNCNAQALAMKD